MVRFQFGDQGGHVRPDSDQSGEGGGVLRVMVMVKHGRVELPVRADDGLEPGRIQPLGGVDHPGRGQPERLVHRLQDPGIRARMAGLSRSNCHRMPPMSDGGGMPLS